jgi:CO dehydrogenase maturation factor
MKIAFVGKGGSGKSTLSSLFTQYLLTQEYSVLVLDADINMHMKNLLNAPVDESLYISKAENKNIIRSFLKGENNRIVDANHFVKTTPPGRGSKFITFDQDNTIIRDYTVPFSKGGRLMVVGTYDEDEIGVSCYHTNLTIAENVLLHTVLKAKEALVCDMVAGTDAFSGSMHLQFDAIILVVEPTPEGVSVFEQYKKLATKAAVFDFVSVIGNKIEDERDIEYLKEKVGDKLLGCLPTIKDIRHARQQNKILSLDMLEDMSVLDTIKTKVEHSLVDPDERLKKVYDLHRIHAKEEYIVSALGDVITQIDESFSFKNV